MAMGGLILALPIVLILLEHDVGSVLTYLPILDRALSVGYPNPLRSCRDCPGSCAVALCLLGRRENPLVKNYQQERINVILDPENADRRGFGYNTWQSILP